VKSFRGEALEQAVITENGAVGDRVWALRELDRGGIMSARVWAAMLHLRATWDGDPAGGGDARDLTSGMASSASNIAWPGKSRKSDTPRGAGGLMSWAVSKTADP